MNMNPKTISVISVIAGVLLIMLILLTVVFSRLNNQGTSEITPTPTASVFIDEQAPDERSLTATIAPTSGYGTYLTPGSGPTIYQDTQEYRELGAQEYQENRDFYETQQAIGKLKEELPYNGKLCTISFDMSNLTFIMTVPNAQVLEGNEECNTYLQKFELSRDDLDELIVRYN